MTLHPSPGRKYPAALWPCAKRISQAQVVPWLHQPTPWHMPCSSVEPLDPEDPSLVLANVVIVIEHSMAIVSMEEPYMLPGLR